MQQYDLTGQLVEDVSTAGPVEVEAPVRPAVQLDLGLRQLVPTVRRSVRWGGQVSQSTLDMELASSDSTVPDMTPDDHNRPAYLGPLGPHRCPGPATCPQRWLTDDELPPWAVDRLPTDDEMED